MHSTIDHAADERFADIVVKESYSEEQSHRRTPVKNKNEIIPMRMPLIKPELGRAPTLAPATRKRWLDQGHDDNGKPVVMVGCDRPPCAAVQPAAAAEPAATA